MDKKYQYIYRTPDDFDDLLIEADDEYLIGLNFVDKKEVVPVKKNKIIEDTIRWLDIYFAGKNPSFIPSYRLDNISPFRKEVNEIMIDIAYGELMTYGDIARKIAERRGIKKMAAQAVGGAVGANPICIIIPCHRVVGNNKKLVGYGGGIKNKIALLELEGIDVSEYQI